MINDILHCSIPPELSSSIAYYILMQKEQNFDKLIFKINSSATKKAENPWDKIVLKDMPNDCNSILIIHKTVPSFWIFINYEDSLFNDVYFSGFNEFEEELQKLMLSWKLSHRFLDTLSCKDKILSQSLKFSSSKIVPEILQIYNLNSLRM